MEIIVNDTNIFIDLHSCGLLDSFFKLPYKVHTTDFVMSELTKGDQYKEVMRFSNQNQLTVKTFSAKELVRIWEYYNNAQKVCNVSIEDCSVLIYTQTLEKARLLTGDKTLRSRAEGEGIVVSGILFVFDELVNHDIITPDEAAIRLIKLVESNVRLPKEEIKKRLATWKQQDIEWIDNF